MSADEISTLCERIRYDRSAIATYSASVVSESSLMKLTVPKSAPTGIISEATATIAVESRPPERHEPTGTSLRMCNEMLLESATRTISPASLASFTESVRGGSAQKLVGLDE